MTFLNLTGAKRLVSLEIPAPLPSKNFLDKCHWSKERRIRKLEHDFIALCTSTVAASTGTLTMSCTKAFKTLSWRQAYLQETKFASSKEAPKSRTASLTKKTNGARSNTGNSRSKRAS